MDAAASPDPITAAPPNLRRRNSISTSGVVPTKLSLPTTQTTTKDGAVPPPPPPQLDFELISLKDLIPFSPSGVNSPTAASAANSGYEITIRNRLVKQAAWAYLQPMSSSPSSYDSHFLRRLWLKLAAQKPFDSCLNFINLHLIPTLTRAFDRILRALCLRTEK